VRGDVRRIRNAGGFGEETEAWAIFEQDRTETPF